MHYACLPKVFWQEAMEAAVHINNCQPMRSLKWETPISKWDPSISKSDVSGFRVFECWAYIFIHKEDHQDKLSPKAKEMIFLGYPAGVKGYKFFDPKSQRIVIASSATFNKLSFAKCSDRDNEPDLIISEDDNNLETEDHQDQEEENTEDGYGNPPMDITFDQDLLPNLDPNLEQWPETPLLKTPSPSPTTPSGTPQEYQHFPPISSLQRPQLRHLPPLSPHALARPPPPRVTLRRSQRIPRPRFDLDNAYR